jgi:hypothetical protein
MKFKSQDKQNQLIENILSLHLVVGVDIAQEARRSGGQLSGNWSRIAAGREQTAAV